MADRHPSFFGPVVPVAGDAPEAFSAAELVRIRAAHCEADLIRAGASGWPETRRFETIRPAASEPSSVRHAAAPAGSDGRVVVVVNDGATRRATTVVVRNGGDVRTILAH